MAEETAEVKAGGYSGGGILFDPGGASAASEKTSAEYEALGGEARFKSMSWGAVMGAYCAPYSTGRVYSFPLSLDNKETPFDWLKAPYMDIGP